MGIITECQVVITCDSCGETFIEAWHRRLTIKIARSAGWKIDKNVTCPKCYAKIFEKPSKEEKP